MRKELGKWLLDIAKYIVTAVILTTVFEDLNASWAVYILGLTSVVITLLIGLYLIKDKKEKGA